MYFPRLNHLNNSINRVVLNSFDEWLAVQRRAVLKNLTPVRFSVQSNIEIDIAIDMFSLAAEVKVIKANYVILCPRCEAPQFPIYDSLDAVPNYEIVCECGDVFVPATRTDFIELTFERVVEPTLPPSRNSVERSVKERGRNQGKAQSLRVSDIEKAPDMHSQTRRQFLMGLQNRFEAAQ